MVANKKVINSKDISSLFGLNSEIFKDFYDFLKLQKSLTKIEFQQRYNKWKSTFYNIYGSEIDEELFLKHSYFVSLLKTILIIKLKQTNHEIEIKHSKSNIELIFQPEMGTFFCPDISDEVYNEILLVLIDSTFANEDLFQGLYQEIFFIITRHKIGEFYTPTYLVKKMVHGLYQVGLKILDPSCGSGSFIIEIINTIIKSDSSNILKLKAIEKVYGFDINPLATITTRINVALLLIENLGIYLEDLPNFHIYNLDGLFPENSIKDFSLNLKELYNSFDLIVGNPPWLTYKDLLSKEYQSRVRALSESLDIKPPSQYITHIELGSIFFYASAKRFLKLNGVIFFVITKSVLNGDHCYKFRAFKIFKDIEIWDFPESYLFNIQHICLKAKYIGENTQFTINDKYPIVTTILNSNFEVKETLYYSSIKIEEGGARIILPEPELRLIKNLSDSSYKEKFFQGATLVPKTLVFFTIEQNLGKHILISSDPEILKRAKKKWYFEFKNQKIEPKFAFLTFLNKDMVPFYIKQYRHVFLPIDANFEYNINLLKQNPLSSEYYYKINKFYERNKKETSKIEDLFSNLNYWNKLSKQKGFKSFNVVYNASGSSLKAAVIDNSQKNIIISSENYYYSTDIVNEAYYLCALLNAPILSKFMKLIKSSRHIHKRPFSFPIPMFNKEDENHIKLAKKGVKYHSVVQDLVANNKKISSEKVRTFIHQKLSKLNDLAKEVIFNPQ